MNNALKHSKASRINISILKKLNKLEVCFEDNGVGFDVNKLKTSKQFGIVGMRERIQGLNGKFELQSNKHGTKIFGLVPIKKN